MPCSAPSGPIVLDSDPLQCYALQDTSDTLELCFTFTAPGSLLLFAAVPPANCSNYQVTAALYDSACNLVDSPAFGILTVTRGASYIWCAKYICSGSIGFGPLFCPTFSDFSPLPVTWLYFFGSYNEQLGAVQLSWATATEINSSHFEVEQSYDGEQYDFIGRLPAAGYSTTAKRYTAIDDHPGTVNYYRIKQVDWDGDFSYSNTIVVYSRKAYGEDPAWIFDISGRLLRTDGEASRLAPGFYIIKFSDNYSRLLIK